MKKNTAKPNPPVGFATIICEPLPQQPHDAPCANTQAETKHAQPLDEPMQPTALSPVAEPQESDATPQADNIPPATNETETDPQAFDAKPQADEMPPTTDEAEIITTEFAPPAPVDNTLPTQLTTTRSFFDNVTITQITTQTTNCFDLTRVIETTGRVRTNEEITPGNALRIIRDHAKTNNNIVVCHKRNDDVYLTSHGLSSIVSIPLPRKMFKGMNDFSYAVESNALKKVFNDKSEDLNLKIDESAKKMILFTKVSSNGKAPIPSDKKPVLRIEAINDSFKRSNKLANMNIEINIIDTVPIEPFTPLHMPSNRIKNKTDKLIPVSLLSLPSTLNVSYSSIEFNVAFFNALKQLMYKNGTIFWQGTKSFSCNADVFTTEKKPTALKYAQPCQWDYLRHRTDDLDVRPEGFPGMFTMPAESAQLLINKFETGLPIGLFIINNGILFNQEGPCMLTVTGTHELKPNGWELCTLMAKQFVKHFMTAKTAIKYISSLAKGFGSGYNVPVTLTTNQSKIELTTSTGDAGRAGKFKLVENISEVEGYPAATFDTHPFNENGTIRIMLSDLLALRDSLEHHLVETICLVFERETATESQAASNLLHVIKFDVAQSGTPVPIYSPLFTFADVGDKPKAKPKKSPKQKQTITSMKF